MSGIRRTQPTDTFNVIVEAYHNISDGEIDRVEFAIIVNNTEVPGLEVNTREMWFPDDTSFTDPLPGIAEGTAPIWGYGTTLLMSDYDDGTIEIKPTVYAASGESVLLPTITVYNDIGDNDLRPTVKSIYWDWIGGDDSNNGLTLGAPVKTFQKACTEVATTNDCGGGTIYVAATGVHTLQSSNNYSFGANLHTSHQWWLNVTPDPSLDRADTTIETPSTFDGDWMTFAGTGGSTNANIKLSNLRLIPGVTMSSSADVTLNTWTEHCLFEPPEPFNLDSNGGMSVSAYDYRGSPVGISPQGPLGIRYATSCTSRHSIFPGVGNWVRGWFAYQSAGPIIQINADDEAYSNVLISNLHGNDVSGYFPVLTDSLRVELEGGSIYRLQATDNYTGMDFAAHGPYLGDAIQFGVNTAGFSNGANNDTHGVISGGYSGSFPYLAITGFGGTPIVESEATVTFQPARLTDGSTWETLVHSDVVQFNVDDTTNTILSNIAVFSGWQTQGIFNAAHPTSGIAIVNFYDGFVGEDYSLPTRTYTAGAPSKHVIVRNGTFAQVQVDAAEANEEIEWLDCVFSGWGTLAGSMATYTGQGYIDYNHFMTAGEETGGNFTTGLYYDDPVPSLAGNATASASSTAYGSASTLWPKPSVWNTTNSKGAWDNVATADWSSIGSTGVTASELISAGSLNSNAPAIHPYISSPLSGVSTLLAVSTLVYDPSTGSPLITLEPSELFSSSSVIFLDGADVPSVSVTSADSIATATVGTSSSIAVPSQTVSLTVGIAAAVVSNEPIDPPRKPPTELPVFSINVATAIRSLEATVSLKDSELLPVLIDLKKVNNNIADISADARSVWSLNILEHMDDPATSRTVLSINSSNYAKFIASSRSANGVPTNRRQF
tara:strand:+ start:84766 stop:87432 length:2667 start_codon:yes stop_codon:yes gene_type:complete